MTVLLLALSLSADAFAAALCWGLSGRTPVRGVQVGLWFGGAQGIMTLIGALFGTALGELTRQAGRLAAFGVLVFLGLRMLSAALWEPSEEPAAPPAGNLTLAALALATSIDALAAGMSLPYLGLSLLPSAGVIGAVTFLLSLWGTLLGGRCQPGHRRLTSAAGGAVLLWLALRIMLSSR